MDWLGLESLAAARSTRGGAGNFYGRFRRRSLRAEALAHFHPSRPSTKLKSHSDE